MYSKLYSVTLIISTKGARDSAPSSIRWGIALRNIRWILDEPAMWLGVFLWGLLHGAFQPIWFKAWFLIFCYIAIYIIHGYLDIWIYGYVDIWIFGYLDIWIYGYLDIWIFGYLDMYMYMCICICTLIWSTTATFEVRQPVMKPFENTRPVWCSLPSGNFQGFDP